MSSFIRTFNVVAMQQPDGTKSFDYYMHLKVAIQVFDQICYLHPDYKVWRFPVTVNFYSNRVRDDIEQKLLIKGNDYEQMKVKERYPNSGNATRLRQAAHTKKRDLKRKSVNRRSLTLYQRLLAGHETRSHVQRHDIRQSSNQSMVAESENTNSKNVQRTKHVG